MSTLHTLHHANADALSRVIAAAQAGDVLLLREDAVLLARNSLLGSSALATHHVLQADVEARGLQSIMPQNVQLISDTEFVALTLQHDRVIAWR